MAAVVGAWWAQPSMPTWWGDRPKRPNSRAQRQQQANNEVWRSRQTMSGHPADPLGFDPHLKEEEKEKEKVTSSAAYLRSPTMPSLSQQSKLPPFSGGGKHMKKTNSRITLMAGMKRPKSTPDLAFGGGTVAKDLESRKTQMRPLRLQTLERKISSPDRLPKHTAQGSANPHVFNLRVNYYNIANQLQRQWSRSAKSNKDAMSNRKWPTNELREAIKSRLGDEEYESLTQLRVGIIREDCETALSLEVGALRAHPDFLQILAEEAQHRTEDLNADLLLGGFSVSNARPDVDKTHGRHLQPGPRPDSPSDKLAVMNKLSQAFGKPLSARGQKSGKDGPHKKQSPSPEEDHPKKGKKGDKEGLSNEDPSWIAAFGRLREDGEVHRDRIGMALEVVGFQNPNETWIENSTRAVVGNTSTLSQDEFCRVLHNYVDFQRQAWKVEFDKFDEDHSNSIEAHELSHLMQVTGTTPFPDVLAEILEEVDEDGTGSLSFDEFIAVLDLLRKREGFTQREIAEFYSAFDRFLVTGHQEISTGSMQGILGWLGYSPEDKDVEELVAETDADGSGRLNRSEFLHAMRIYREREVARIKAFFAANDLDASGTLGKSELLVLMNQLRHPIRSDVLKELVIDVGVDMEGVDISELELSFDTFWLLLKLYRHRQGYLTQEIEDLKEVFLRYAAHQGQAGPGLNRSTIAIQTLDVHDPDLEMGTIQLGKALRWMGYATTLEQQQAMVNEIDVDGSGALSFAEFMKLMRRWDDSRMAVIKSCFDEMDLDEDGLIGPHCQSELTDTLKALGHVPAKDRVHKIVEARALKARGQSVNLEEFEKLIDQYREQEKAINRDTAGFPENAVQRFKTLFEKYDKDGSGDIQNEELAKLLGDVFPASMTSLAERRKIQDLLAEVDVNGDGRLDFGDFLLMMRQYQDKKDEEMLEKERIAVDECKFTRPEVEQFRGIFQGSTSEGGFNATSSMSLGEVRRVLTRVVPITEGQVLELSAIIKDVTKSAAVITGFPEFLRLMKRLQDTNFANINGAAADIAQKKTNW